LGHISYLYRFGEHIWEEGDIAIAFGGEKFVNRVALIGIGNILFL